MAQTGYTPISIYYSSTAGNTPTSGNLVAGELAINTADGKLFYKDSAGVVQVIAGKGGAGVAGGSNTQVQYNSSGSLAGSANMTFSGTALTLANDASISGLTVGKGSGSGSQSTAIGYQALLNQTGAGDFNTALGYQALASNSTASSNTALGYQAGFSNSTSTYNTFVGGLAGYSVTTGTGRSVAVGYNALGALTTGTDNVAIGYFAGVATVTGNANIFIGGGLYGLAQPAGYLSTSSKNTYVGYTAGSAMTSGASNVIIGGYTGNGSSVDIRTLSNQIVLSDGDGTPRLRIDSGGTQWQYASPGTSQFRPYAYANGTYANNATVNFPSMSGMIIINNWSTGAVAVFICGGGTTGLVSAVGGGYGAMSYTGQYTWTNTSGSTYVYSFTAIATRENA